MTWSKFGKVVGVIAPVVAILAGLLSISDHGDTLRSVAEWLYPLGVIALLAVGLLVVTGLYVDEVRRPWKKLRPTKAETERKERKEEQERRDSERQKMTLIKGEIAPIDGSSRAVWVSLAQIQGADAAYALCLEAYERFAEIDDAIVRRHEVSDAWLRAVAEKATRAEGGLEALIRRISG